MTSQGTACGVPGGLTHYVGPSCGSSWTGQLGPRHLARTHEGPKPLCQPVAAEPNHLESCQNPILGVGPTISVYPDIRPDIGSIFEDLRYRSSSNIRIYTDIGVPDIGYPPISEILISQPMFFSWQVLGSSGQRIQIPAAASQSWLSYCFSTFNFASRAILKCIGLYFGVTGVVAAFAPAAARSVGGVPSAAPPAGPAVLLVVL